MGGLIIMLVVLGGFFKLGHFMGIEHERRGHARAVSEATENISAMKDWRGR
jgi:hypothetical protein